MNIRDWYVRNQDAITWFIIGWVAFAFFDSLARHDFVWAAIDAALIWANYTFSRVRIE